MAVAVAAAQALIRTIRGRSDAAPSSSSRQPLPSPPPGPLALPCGIILEAHHGLGPSPSRRRPRRTSSPSPVRTPPPSEPPLDDTLPPSLATALIGLVAASHRTCHDAQDINVAPRGATAGLRALRASLTSLKLTVQLAYKWLRRVEAAPDLLPHPDRRALVDVDAVVVLLAEAISSVSVAGDSLVDVVRDAAAAAARISDVAAAHAPVLLAASERIDRVEHLLSKLLTILQISSLAEALRARSAIDAAIPLILGDDPHLAASVRCLPDSFHVAPACLDRPPPGYSVPSPADDDAPPDYSAATTNTDGSVTIRPTGWSAAFAGLTLSDLPALSRVPLPVAVAGLRYGEELYGEQFARAVGPALAELMERPGGAKAARLAAILGSRSEGVAMTDEDNFARRVGRELEDGRARTREQPQPYLFSESQVSTHVEESSLAA
ncbi:hypothetical protein ISF_04994 [Cordyceps fumosorosea ARSEF 2679]|uniref:Uncharacterized protein n=1 Tax=Cordyceps fumosorosea (strain ARSEF 2679) TaxID=1081104 RepID=A0A167VYD3_CORFA|nr:hypothetical protein ISF_04994 [Cordyceps fumosorosea ARSEF 2679]OAA63118.1 hypothetical protein ISF_04994 [Cordyceps fumosorosea ARSEF 2679]